MISEYAKNNFKIFMQANPAGANDSALPHPKGPQLRIADFEAGGAHDAVGEGAMLEPSDVAGVAAWCKKNLDLKQLGELVARLTDGDMAADDSRKRLAKDRRPQGDTVGFYGRFPEAKGIRNLGER